MRIQRLKFLNVVKANEEMLSTVLFTVTISSIFGQVYLPGLSRFITPSLILLFMINLRHIYQNIERRNKSRVLMIIFLSTLILALIYSIVLKSNNIGLAIRFFTIMSLIPLAFFLPGKEKYIKIFIFLVLVQSVVIVSISLFLSINSNPSVANHLRRYVTSQGIGDIYTYNGWFYRVQLKGNPLIPIAFYIFAIRFHPRMRDYIIYSILLLAIIIAGNLAFWIATLFFVVCVYLLQHYQAIIRFILAIYQKYQHKFLIISITVVALVLIVTVIYLLQMLELKMQTSIPTRFDQVFVLLDNLQETSLTMLLGQGLGNTVDVITKYRNYTGLYYYELQIFYILNQLGIMIFTLFVFIKIFLLRNLFNNRFILLIYASYLLFALTNPYMFDTTNILVIILLISLKDEIKEVPKWKK